MTLHHTDWRGGTDYQDVIVSDSCGHIALLSCTLTLAPAVSCPTISTENAITATSPGTRSTRSSRSQLGIKTADPVSPSSHAEMRVPERGDESSSRGLIGSLDEIMCMIPKKNLRYRSLKKEKKRSFNFPVLLFPLRLSYLCCRLSFRSFEGEHQLVQDTFSCCNWSLGNIILS